MNATASPRTDRHTPSRLIPSEYRFRIAFAYPGMWPDMGYNIRQAANLRIAHLNSGGTVFHKANGTGGCSICGANFRHGVIFEHVPTSELIHIGWQCAEKLELLSEDAFAAKKTAKNATMIEMARARKRRERRAGLRTFAAEATAELRKALRADHDIVRDIRVRLIAGAHRWNGLTEKQEALVLKLARKAAEPVVVEKHVTAPEGRQVIQGRVVSVKWHDNAFGGALKMTVKITTPTGVWLAWGTVPSSISDDVERGSVVEFTGTLKQGRDSHFAFFKRPSKASIIVGPAA